ncbi:MAG: hypothetical protein LBG50_02400 [Clostridiales Family XIII bacterium]|jgi:type II secretory pathway pseudopilin PulG|nr:hypothetical protein [Clostridiales Family XIII bacterium]
MKISKTAIFLFELMVVILIFSIAAAVCTNVFGKAYGFSEESKDLTMAVLKAESIAEEFKAGGADKGGELLFDKDWIPIDKNRLPDFYGQAAYEITSRVTVSGGIRIMDISVDRWSDDRMEVSGIYDLQVKAYGE